MHDEDHDRDRDRRNRYTVPEAAQMLGVTQDAVRKRITRHTIKSERDADGRVYVYLDPSEIVHDAGQDRDRDELLESYRDQIAYLRSQIDARTEELRRKDHIIAALTERIPELEASKEGSRSSEAAQEARERPDQPPETSTTPEGAEDVRERNTRPWWRIW